MRTFQPMGGAFLALALSAGVAGAQTVGGARDAYSAAVAEFFDLPRSEVSILEEWRLPLDEVPVVLYMARRAGVSPEALVALRRSGRGWVELAQRYHLDASHFHVPLPDQAPAGMLTPAYQRFRALPRGRWGEVALSDEEIVALVNLRVLARTLVREPAEVLAAAGPGTWAERYVRLMGG